MDSTQATFPSQVRVFHVVGIPVFWEVSAVDLWCDTQAHGLHMNSITLAHESLAAVFGS